MRCLLFLKKVLKSIQFTDRLIIFIKIYQTKKEKNEREVDVKTKQKSSEKNDIKKCDRPYKLLYTYLYSQAP